MKITTLFLTLSLMLAACTATQVGPLATSVPTSAPSAENTPTTPPETSVPPTSRPQTNAEDNLANTKWMLESFGTVGSETPVIGEAPLTLEFTSEGQVGGEGGCNSFGGSYQAERNSLVLSELISTLVACVDTELMDQEVQYLNALQTAGEFEIDGDHLSISYNQGQGILSYVSANASPTEEVAPATETPEPEAEAPSTPASEAEQPSAGASTGESQHFIWTCFSCPGNEVWNFENGQANRIQIPVELSNFFGYAPATDRILYSSPLPLLGGGPSQITVGDLWILDVASGQAKSVFSEQKIVEAEWAPDGEQIVYVLATDTTYELRWHEVDGEDKLLASDVAFTFSVSPTGDKVAFTRESNYNLSGQPGLYVVDVATGEEIKISNTDRAGSGSIDDKPVWSPSGQYVLLTTYGTMGGPSLVRAAADGSGATALQFDPSLSAEEWYQAAPFIPFWVSETQIIASANLGGQNAQMGGMPTLMFYQLNESSDTIINGAVIGEGQLIGWDVPGSSVWLQPGPEMQSVPLPSYG